MSYDLVIKNGVVIDGSGVPRYGATSASSAGGSPHRPHPGVRARGGRRGPGGLARVHRWSHAHGRAGRLGSARHLLVLARGDLGGHGQLRVHAGPAPCRPSDIWSCATWNGRRTSPRTRWRRASTGRGRRIPEYLDALDRLPKGINYAGYVGHSALRTWAMGERAFEEPATEEDLVVMARELRDALRAGAVGFTTSRSNAHQTSDDRPVASRLATWDEVAALVGVMGDLGGGVFELASETVRNNEELATEYYGRLSDLAVATGVPITFGVLRARGRRTAASFSTSSTPPPPVVAACSARPTAASSIWCCRSRPSSPSTCCRSGRSCAPGRSTSRGGRCATPPA